MNLLENVKEKLLKTIELSEILDIFKETLMSEKKISGFFTALYEENKTHMNIAQIHLPKNLKKFHTLYQNMTLPLIETQKTLERLEKEKVLHILEKEKQQYTETLRKLIEAWNIQEAYIVPLKKEGTIFGFHFIFSNAAEFPPTLFQFFEELTKTCENSIFNALKYYYLKIKEHNLNEADEKNKKLVAIMTKINQLHSPEEIYKIILEEISLLFSFDISSLYLEKNKNLIPVSFWLDKEFAYLHHEIETFFKTDGKYQLSLNESGVVVCFIQNTRFYINDFQNLSGVPILEKDKKTMDILKTLRTSVLIPIREENKTIGVLSLATLSQPLELAPKDLQLFESLSSLISIAIRNAEIYSLVQKQKEQILKRTAELAIINSIAHEMNKSPDFDQTLNKIIQYLLETYNFEGSVFTWVNQEENSYTVESFFGNEDFKNASKEISGKVYNLDLKNGGILAWCILNNQDVFSKNFQEYSKEFNFLTLNDPFNQQLLKTYQPKSILYMPISIENEVIGIFTLVTIKKALELSQEDIEGIRRLINQLSSVLRNSKLYSEVEKTKNELIEKNRIIFLDIKMARKIQKALLSSELKEDYPISLFAYYKPQSEIGGDIYDITSLSKNKLRLFLADATGHGIQAALITILIKSEYEKIKNFDLPPDEILKILNNSFAYQYSQLTIFFSCILLDIDFQNGKIEYSSAGHPAQFLIKSENILEIKSKGKLIGLAENAKYTLKTTPFVPSDKLLLFSDGLFEEFNEQGEELLEEGLLKLVKKIQNAPIHELGNYLVSSLEQYIGKGAPQDDITLIGIEYQ
ncbi:MAG TPA: hypothetical protein DHW82_02845 [Spirochaetia bacterium]|nr:MAG: hypothetical protein A2Y41_03805 [Spirochaetes bacterium GWB1_36_13]HCL55928.1 hypothetical protein [Spirochaetia bacterium]